MKAFRSFKYPKEHPTSHQTRPGVQEARVLGDDEDAAELGTISGVPTSTPPGTLSLNVPVNIDPGIFDRQFHPDLCDLGLFQSGLLVNLELRVDGQVRDSTASCLGQNTVFEVDAFLSDTGTREIEVVALGGNSGVEFGSESLSVTVSEGADPPNGISPPPNGGTGDLLDNVREVFLAGAGFLGLLLIFQALN